MKKIICLIVTGACLFLFLQGCSTMKNIFSWVKFWDSEKSFASLTDKQMARFPSISRRNQRASDSHYRLACYYQNQGKHKEAIKEFDKVLSINPNYANAYNGMGVSYDLMGNYPKAVESYEKALKVNPN